MNYKTKNKNCIRYILALLIAITITFAFRIPAFAAFSSDQSGAEEAYELYRMGYQINLDDWTLVVMTNPLADEPKNYDQTSFIYYWDKIRARIYKNGEDSFESLSKVDKAKLMYSATREVIDNGWEPDNSGDSDDTEEIVGFDWILPLNVPEDFDAKETAGQAAGIALVICQQFGVGVLLVGLMEFMLSLKDDNPATKERASKTMYTGVLLVSIYILLQNIDIIAK